MLDEECGIRRIGESLSSQRAQGNTEEVKIPTPVQLLVSWSKLNRSIRPPMAGLFRRTYGFDLRLKRNCRGTRKVN